MYKVTIDGLDPHEVGHRYLSLLIHRALEKGTAGMTDKPINVKDVRITVGWEDPEELPNVHGVVLPQVRFPS